MNFTISEVETQVCSYDFIKKDVYIFLCILPMVILRDNFEFYLLLSK